LQVCWTSASSGDSIQTTSALTHLRYERSPHTLHATIIPYNNVTSYPPVCTVVVDNTLDERVADINVDRSKVLTPVLLKIQI
jgi:hypothetical protein